MANNQGEIHGLREWLKKERKRAWVPWLRPIIEANKNRLAYLMTKEGGSNAK